uniref:Fucosyltransferase n=1 Tax=Ditylenchus dipsaci TaxID=166011 RepID=A0A915DTX3_9BILA
MSSYAQFPLLEWKSSLVQFANLHLEYNLSMPLDLYLCEDVKYFVFVPTRPSAFKNRSAIRESWAKKPPAAFLVRFVVGQPNITTEGVDIYNKLHDEWQKYNDIIFYDAKDDYRMLHVKVYAVLTWQQLYCSNVQFVIRADADTIIDLDRLQYWMNNGLVPAGNTSLIFGALFVTGQLARDPNHRQYVSHDEYPGNTLPPYIWGFFYGFSNQAVKAVLHVSHTVKGFPLDDLLYTGVLAEKAGVKLVNVTKCLELTEKDESVQSNFHSNKISDPQKYAGILKSVMFDTISNFSGNFVQPLDPPVVLAWTKFFGDKLFESNLLKHFQPSECPYKCTFSDNTDLYANNASIFVFHIRDLDENRLPPANPKALNAFLLVESAIYSDEHYKRVPVDYFNLSVTYRTTRRKIGGRNMRYQKAQKQKESSPTICIQLSDQFQREKYVEELKKFMKITEFGKCNNKSCPGNECLEEKIDSHLFYLAFENSVCKQYVTEKFWNIKRLIVPVVLNRQVMHGLGIPDSAYIAVNDFAGPRELAARLSFLQANQKEYLEHFEWTKSYKKIAAEVNPLCKLCQFAVEKRKLSIPNIVEFWEKEGECKADYSAKLLG